MVQSRNENASETQVSRREQALLDHWARKFRAPLIHYIQRRAPARFEPEDLVQDIFLRLARRADLATIERVEGYLFQTAASVLADRYRKDGRSLDFVESFDDSLQGEEVLTPERVVIGRESLDELVKALHLLPERTRNIFVLYHFEGVRQKDIAGRFEMPISTVEKHMARANKHLLQRVGRTL